MLEPSQGPGSEATRERGRDVRLPGVPPRLQGQLRIHPARAGFGSQGRPRPAQGPIRGQDFAVTRVLREGRFMCD